MGRVVPVPSGGSIARVSVSVWLRPRIKALLQGEEFDVTHLHEPMAGAVTVSALAAAGSVNSVNIGTFHSYKGTRLYGFGGNRLAMRYFRRLDGLIAVSEPARQFINRHLPGDYEIIPNGVDVDRFACAEPLAELKDGMINLLYFGRLEKRKGLRYLLGAYSRLKWDWPNLRLIVAGPGKPDDESYRIMAERNLTDVVFAGAVSEEDKARYYRTADIYCSPATGGESQGIVLLEAMAAGAPVVASNIEGFSSVITHGRDGMLVEPKREDALADAIRALLTDRRLAHRLESNARDTVEKFRWSRVASRVLAHYKSRLAARSVALTG
jgi:phosphatidylinositol alpha-mannosyltransferase